MKLIGIGCPDLIEVKAVTYCGKSDGSSLTMANVPWHEEVRKFCEALCTALGGTYGLATEHAHSCCVLLAKPTFQVCAPLFMRTPHRCIVSVSRWMACGTHGSITPNSTS